MGIIRTVEVELQNKISDLRVALDFETGAHKTNSKKANEVRKKLAKMGDTEELPALLTEEQMADLVLSDLEFRSTLHLPRLPHQACTPTSTTDTSQMVHLFSLLLYLIENWLSLPLAHLDNDEHCHALVTAQRSPAFRQTGVCVFPMQKGMGFD